MEWYEFLLVSLGLLGALAMAVKALNRSSNTTLQMAETIAALNVELREASRDRQAHQAEREAWETERLSFSRARQAWEAERARLDLEVKRLGGLVENYQTTSDDLKRQLDQVCEQLETAQQARGNQAAAIADLRRDLEAAQNTIAGLRSDLEAAQNTIAGLRSDLEAARDTIAGLKAQIVQYEDTIRRMEAEIGTLRHDLAEQEAARQAAEEKLKAARAEQSREMDHLREAVNSGGKVTESADSSAGEG